MIQELFSYLSSGIYSFLKGLLLGGSVCVCGYLLDNTISSKSQETLIKEKTKPFLKAHYYIATNLLIISPSFYIVIDQFFLQKKIQFEIFKYCAIILTHNLVYFFIHREMHRNNKLRWVHKFHHEFDIIVTPSIGNTVSHEEFLLAYICPFILAAVGYRPTEITFISAIGTISVFNMLIHMMELDGLWWIPGLVAPTHHIYHHKTKNAHFSAPIMDLDDIMDNYVFIA
jgi:sterol desaturase/sphingolipid hydroxylase (fatty acid hydroxylase superfamily)